MAMMRDGGRASTKKTQLQTAYMVYLFGKTCLLDKPFEEMLTHSCLSCAADKEWT